MPGSRITRNQEELYMKSRQKGLTQEAAAARTGISTRSGRSIELRNPIDKTAKLSLLFLDQPLV